MGSYSIHCYARPPNDIPVGPGHSQLSPWSLLLDWGFILSCVLPPHALFWAHCVGQFPGTPQASLALLPKCLLIPYVLLLPLPSPCLVHTHPDILPFFCLSDGPVRHFSSPPHTTHLYFSVHLYAHEHFKGFCVNFSFALYTFWELSNC